MRCGSVGGPYATTRDGQKRYRAADLVDRRAHTVLVYGGVSWGRRGPISKLDDEMVERAMALYGTRSKKETVDLALRRLVGAALSTEEALALEGTGWDAEFDALRDDLPPASV